MEKDDLTVVKHIGAVRMKVLNDAGIDTLEALYNTPVERLAEIKSIGERYAGLIKAAVAGVYTAPAASEEVRAAEEPPAAEAPIAAPIDEKLNRRVKKLNKALSQADEKLKPLDKKKRLALYVDVKKTSKKLKRRLNRAVQLEVDLPKKVRKNVIKSVDGLCAAVKSIDKKPKKKTYILLHQEMQSFAKMLRQNGC